MKESSSGDPPIAGTAQSRTGQSQILVVSEVTLPRKGEEWRGMSNADCRTYHPPNPDVPSQKLRASRETRGEINALLN